MARYLLLRLVRLLFALWLTASGVFLLSRSLPADVILQQLSAGEISATTSSAQQRIAEQRFLHRLGLDIPLFYFSLPSAATHQRWQWHGQHNQYHQWARQLLRGNLGHSYRDGQPVTSLLAVALTYTLPLTTLAATASILLAVWLTTRLAVHQQLRPHVLRLLYALDALPLFVLGLLLLLLFANPDVLVWFPAYGLGDEVSELTDASVVQRIGTLLYYLALPLTCLILVNLPHLVVQLDAALQKERLTGYAVTARAKGAPEKQVVQRHTLRNALLPTLTQLNSLLPALVAGAVVVEVIFALPGVGRLLAEAAATHDYPVIMGGVLLTALVRLLAQFLTDGLYLVADPRIRLRA